MRRSLLHWGLTAGAILAALGLVAALVVVSGLVPIKASSGHWDVTNSLLTFVKRRSVSTQSLGTKLPNLQNPMLVLHGAGTYDHSCRPCHGSPEFNTPTVPAAMLPPPPYLPPIVNTYEPEELFSIVKHGIKFTGMPAWPTQQRDDEVHAMVAFLLELPNLDANAYRQLVMGQSPDSARALPLPQLPGAARAVTTNCARCHGGDGQGRGLGAFPKIAGQKPDYLWRALNAYAEHRRPSGAMAPLAAALSEEERRVLSDYYAALPPGPPAEAADTNAPEVLARALRGKAIATDGVPAQGVPSCKDCHGPSNHAHNPAYPNLAGQYANYLQLQLELFKSVKRGGSSYSHLMHHVASRLNEEQMKDVATFYASLDAAQARKHAE